MDVDYECESVLTKIWCNHIRYIWIMWLGSIYKHQVHVCMVNVIYSLFQNMYRPYDIYDVRLAVLEMLELEDSRKYFDNCLFHSIIHKPTYTQLSNQLTHRNHTRSDRRRHHFRSVSDGIYYGLMVDPIAKILRLYVNELNESQTSLIDCSLINHHPCLYSFSSNLYIFFQSNCVWYHSLTLLNVILIVHLYYPL